MLLFTTVLSYLKITFEISIIISVNTLWSYFSNMGTDLLIKLFVILRKSLTSSRSHGKEGIQIATKHKKRWSMTCVIKNSKLKKTMRYHCISIRLARIWNTGTTRYFWGYEATRALIYCWWGCKIRQPLWKKFGGFLQT